MSGELSASLDPRQVADLMAGHMARAMGVDECAISYWDRPGRPGRIAGLLPGDRPRGDRAVLRRVRLSPRRCASWSTRRRSSSTPRTRPPTRPRSRCCGRTATACWPCSRSSPRASRSASSSSSRRARCTLDAERLELARTMANEAAMALENARLYEDARKLADRDPLTGFYNHRFLHERLGEEVVRAQRGRRPLSVLMLDLDDFKLVNDTFGHLFGDRVLTWTAELDPLDPARLGHARPLRRRRVRGHPARDRRGRGRGASPSASSRRSATTPFVGEQRGPVPIGVSIGVATFPTDGADRDRAHRRGRPRPLPGQARRRPRCGGRGAATPPDAGVALRYAAVHRHEVRTAVRRPIRTDVPMDGTGPGPPSCHSDVSQPTTQPSSAPADRPTDRSAGLGGSSSGDLPRPRSHRPARAWSPAAPGRSTGSSSALAARRRRRGDHPRVAVSRARRRGRRAEAESFARILSGLSRSVSPDAILDAIVEEVASSDRGRPHRRRPATTRRPRPRGHARSAPAPACRLDAPCCPSPTSRTRSSTPTSSSANRSRSP